MEERNCSCRSRFFPLILLHSEQPKLHRVLAVLSAIGLREDPILKSYLIQRIYQKIMYFNQRGWSGGAMVLGKIPVPGRPTNLENSRARAYCTCSGCGWGVVWTFFSLVCHFSFLSPSLWETARYRLKYCLKGLLSLNQPTNFNQTLFSEKMQGAFIRAGAIIRINMVR